MLGWRGKRAQVVGSGVASGGGAVSTPPAEAAGDVAALRSRVGELERRNAELAEQKAGLEREIEGLRKENAELRATAAAGDAQLRDLRAQLGQNSRNSSRPPSSDSPAVPRRKRRRRGPLRQRGGQPGHPGHRHPLVPPEQVDEHVHCYPEQCGNCQAALSPAQCSEVGDAVISQSHEVEIRRHVTQYDQHRLVCGRCGASTLGALPPEAVHSRYGPSLTALVAVLSGVSQLARREVSRLCGELFGVPVSVGSVQKLCEQMSDAVAVPLDALAAAIRQQPVVGMDETSWRVQHKLRYLWVVWSPLGSIYKIGTRAAKVGQSLLGAAFAGCVMTDRYKGYDWIPWLRRQLCWAHLDRDARALIDLGKSAGEYGKGIHRAARAVFGAWQNFQQAGEGPAARVAMQAALEPVQQALRPLLRQGRRSRTRKVVNLCKALDEAWESLWLFCSVPGVEPTNNGSERRIRKGVQWRKKSLGTHSAGGGAFAERMLAVTDTCRQQGRSPLTYLIAAAKALRAGTPAPALVPDAPGEAAPQPAASAAGLQIATPAPEATAPAVETPAPTRAPQPAREAVVPPAADGAGITAAAEALRAGTSTPPPVPDGPGETAPPPAAARLRPATPRPEATAATLYTPAPTRAPHPGREAVLPPAADGAGITAAAEALRAGTSTPPPVPDGPGETAPPPAPDAAPRSGAAPMPDRPRPATSADATQPLAYGHPVPAADRPATPNATAPRRPRGSTASRRGPNSTFGRLVVPRVASP